MDQFIYYLAETKYRMYHELHIFKPSAYTHDECSRRLEVIHKYHNLLEIIAMLPLNEQRQLSEIEQEYFSDAPYVSKSR
jgi:hypothetical protein